MKSHQSARPLAHNHRPQHYLAGQEFLPGCRTLVAQDEAARSRLASVSGQKGGITDV
jgi:hypothetical protein